jgi:hypothetical protein
MSGIIAKNVKISMYVSNVLAHANISILILFKKSMRGSSEKKQLKGYFMIRIIIQ